MKIGIFSDVHSDVHSLKRVLEHLHGVDQLLCVGDVVEAGRTVGDEAVALLGEIPCVQGNHDQYALENDAWLLKNADMLTDERFFKRETVAHLGQLPLSLRFMWAGWRVLVEHGTFWNLTPNSPARFFKYFAERAAADIIILGHTHVPMQAEYQGVRFYNPGAVTARMGGVRCAILTLPEQTFEVWDVGQGKPLEVPLLVMQEA